MDNKSFINCPYCQRKISYGAYRCKRCQAEIEYGPPILAVLITIILPVILGWLALELLEYVLGDKPPVIEYCIWLIVATAALSAGVKLCNLLFRNRIFFNSSGITNIDVGKSPLYEEKIHKNE